nr:hypothetical protein [Clostridium sp.]
SASNSGTSSTSNAGMSSMSNIPNISSSTSDASLNETKKLNNQSATNKGNAKK